MNFRLKILFILLLIICLILSGTVFFLWQKIEGLHQEIETLWQKIEAFEPVVYYYVPPERTFIYAPEEPIIGIENYIRAIIEKEKAKLKNERRNFIYANLKEMKLHLYKEGKRFDSFPVLAKGADWFWGKTAPGVYYVASKATLLFSEMGLVWMPYSIRYFGSYFIHGVPWDLRGRLLVGAVSGGCIRLRTADAAKVFNFVEIGTPILIFEEIVAPPLLAIVPVKQEVVPPKINAQFALVADLDTGEIILNKEGDSEFYAGPATNIMLALTAAESINLAKRIFAREWMFEGAQEGIIVPGKSYRGRDLLYPLLLYTSREAALVLSRFLTPQRFVYLMNKKARGIAMKNSFFVDVTGESKENITTLYDVARMMHYIKDFRPFILDIANRITGAGENETKSTFAVFEMRHNEYIRSIFIGIVNSPDVDKDLKTILEWLDKNFNLKLDKKN
jgi:hypothetical protein